jgi:type VI secretion system secreted protein VgrG
MATALALSFGWISLMGAGGANATGLPGSAAFLDTAGSYAVIAAATVTNTGFTVLTGDLGLSPNGSTSVTGFPPGVLTGTAHTADSAAVQARLDLHNAYAVAAALVPTLVVGTADLNGSVFAAGVYRSASSLLLSVGGTVTLNGGVDDVFVFQAGSTLTTGSGSTVLLTGGAQACNVFWQIGSSATLGTNSDFAGTIMADTSITATTGVSVVGRLLASANTLSGAVTLDSTSVNSASACLTGGGGSPPAGPALGPPAPGPGPGPGTSTTASGDSLAATGLNLGVPLLVAVLALSVGVVVTCRPLPRRRLAP